MTHKKPDDIVDAKAEGSPAPEPFVNPYLQRKKNRGGGLMIVILLLAAVGVVAWVCRVSLTSFYDTKVATLWQEAPKPAEPVPSPEPKRVAERPTERPKVELPDQEVPKFDKREVAVAPAETPAPVDVTPPPETPKEIRLGLAYSIADKRDTSNEGVKQYEFKVVVPPTYDEEALLRMAKDIVVAEQRLGPRHGIRILCYQDPKKTADEDNFAEVDWGPGGDYFKAADAATGDPAKNTFRVILRNK